ncbi:MAG: hypothetical protein IT425_04480 [Pirellulales bacterium]|nr:hypothetical protein [Pirellulales bacterium]
MTGWQTKYQYIPGLQKGDPGDLVVMYLKTPTRWVHHAAGPSSRFEHAYWMVTPFDFTGVADPKIAPPVRRDIPARGECSERLTDKEFAARLRKTLKYLQDNNRPNWQTVVAENEKLLSSLEKE